MTLIPPAGLCQVVLLVSRDEKIKNKRNMCAMVLVRGQDVYKWDSWQRATGNHAIVTRKMLSHYAFRNVYQCMVYCTNPEPLHKPCLSYSIGWHVVRSKPPSAKLECSETFKNSLNSSKCTKTH